MNNIRRYGKNQQEMLEVKTIASDMKNAFSGLNRLTRAEESVSLKITHIESFQIETQIGVNFKKKTRISSKN